MDNASKRQPPLKGNGTESGAARRLPANARCCLDSIQFWFLYLWVELCLQKTKMHNKSPIPRPCSQTSFDKARYGTTCTVGAQTIGWRLFFFPTWGRVRRLTVALLEQNVQLSSDRGGGTGRALCSGNLRIRTFSLVPSVFLLADVLISSPEGRWSQVTEFGQPLKGVNSPPTVLAGGIIHGTLPNDIIRTIIREIDSWCIRDDEGEVKKRQKTRSCYWIFSVAVHQLWFGNVIVLKKTTFQNENKRKVCVSVNKTIRRDFEVRLRLDKRVVQASITVH